MATYGSYKRVNASESVDDRAITEAKLGAGARRHFGTQWFWGSPSNCSPGCCCLWTVPSHVTRLRWEIWGSGGNGHGACVDNRCQHFKGAGGGQYNTITIATSPGCQYTVCAAGVFPCNSVECISCLGCSSYVTGFNLSNFCAIGGTAGCANADWTTKCSSCWECCIQSGVNGGEFGMISHSARYGGVDWWFTVGFCHCFRQTTEPTSAPLMGVSTQQSSNYCWMRCGCWTVPYGSGGQGAQTNYCGTTCCGQGGTGGPGVVKVTYF